MSIETDIPLVLQQMGRVQKIAEQEKSRPERQQAATREAARRGGELARDHVAETHATEQSHLDVDEDGRGQQFHQHLSADSRMEEESDQEVETQPTSESAWQGKIIDTKV
ncbi:hypothetical protein [Halodesulfovibrio spirochaetisodalis]|uniref:Uncharacterized protein n=1 Tax=Halodesulfovibrio spirochaetisodalis TaxID=1560234 RepID=A0A1B7XBS2_9BACT|nr:hypothetical protein [Halodesulfovibrio spirochaetisodalis]OBQ50163.1 hypothetical protein SP90_10360 [Halodesulfovibrio spirochaetisodalis]